MMRDALPPLPLAGEGRGEGLWRKGFKPSRSVCGRTNPENPSSRALTLTLSRMRERGSGSRLACGPGVRR
jgi:hypothetical protein